MALMAQCETALVRPFETAGATELAVTISALQLEKRTSLSEPALLWVVVASKQHERAAAFWQMALASGHSLHRPDG